jgi:hypothetical protein
MADPQPIEGTLQSTAFLAGNDEPKRNGPATILQFILLVLAGVVTLGTTIAGDSETAKLTGVLGFVSAGIISAGKYAQFTALILGEAKRRLPMLESSPVTINTGGPTNIDPGAEPSPTAVPPSSTATSGTEIPGAGHTQTGTVTDDGVEISPGEGDPLPPGATV